MYTKIEPKQLYPAFQNCLLTFFPVSVKYSIMFGKKKKKEDTASADPVDGPMDQGDSTEDIDIDENPSSEAAVGSKKKKKFFTFKKILFILLFFLAVGTAGAVVYVIYFHKSASDQGYVTRELANITLPEEILHFSYDFMPEFYTSLITFNSEVILLEQEIERIAALAEQYPDQKKIAEKEIKIWEKEKAKLKKAYEKLEKKQEALYVLYRVNKDSGLQRIDEQKSELSKSAQDALTGSMALTARLKLMSTEEIPEGFVKGTLYKVKKKISELTD